MKEGWTYKKLGEVCEVTDYVANGSFATLKENVTYYNEPNYAILVRLADYSSNFDKSKFVYVDEHSYNFLSKSKLYGGEIIMSNVGSVGKCFICPNLGQPMTIGPNSVLIRTPNSQYFYYYFQSESFQNKLRTITNKATLAKFNKTQFRDIEIYFPSNSEQQRIVSRLDSAFAHIDELKANAEKQLSEARALFQKALTKAMEPKEGWEEKPLKQIAKYSIGLTYKPSDVSEKGTIVLRSSNIQEDKLDLNDIVRVTCPIKESLYVKKGDILMCSRNGSARLVGKVTVIPETKEKMTYGTFMMVISSDYNPYLFYFFKSDDFRSQIKHGEANMINQITRYMLDDVTVSVPPFSEQQRIVSRLDSLSAHVRELEDVLQKTIVECDVLKQALLRKVFE